MSKTIKLGAGTEPAGLHAVAGHPSFDMPPAAMPMPGIKGTLPLNVGQISTEHLLPEERAVLDQIPGWEAGAPIPGNMAELLDKAQQAAKHEVSSYVPALPENAKALDIQTVNITDLPEEKQLELASYIKWAGEQQAAAIAAPTLLSSAPTINVVMDLKQEKDEKAEKSNVPEEDRDTTGIRSNALRKCPHCSWDLAVKDVAEPSGFDKQAYIQCWLGQKPFKKEYQLYHGAVSVWFRELTSKELDVIFTAAHKRAAAETTEVAKTMAFPEWIERYRLAAQLVAIRTTENSVNCPETLEGWSTLGAADLGACLESAYSQLFSTAIATESMTRVLIGRLVNFSQTLAKLEASATSSDF